MAANHISKDKIVGRFFNRASRRADISGNVPSDHFVTSEGKKGRRTADKVKIHDDIQHKGWCFTSNGSSSLMEKDLIGSSSATLSVSSISIGLFHFLVYIPDTLIDQGNQKLFGRQNDIGIQIRTSSGGLSIRVRGNYRPYWLYEFEDESYKLNDWNWISVYRDGSNTTDTTLSSANEAVKVWINGTQLNNLTTANPGTQSTGNSAAEWTLLDWEHVDSGFNPANYLSLFSFFGRTYPFDAGPDLSVVTDIQASSFSLQKVESLYAPNADIGCYCGGESQPSICFGHLIESPHNGDIYVKNDLPGFIDNTIVTPYSIVNELGYNVAGPSYFKNAYVADDHAQRTPAWEGFMADADFSIAFKVNISTRQDGNVYDIMSNSGGISSGVYILITGGKIQITVTKSSSNTRTVISRDLRDGLDHDILVVYEVNSLQCRVYIDGLEEPYGAQVTGVGGNLYNPNTSWVIGKYAVSAGDRNFTGYIKEVSFYNSALTPATLKTANPVAQPQVASDGTVTDLVGGSTWASNNLDNTDLVPADSTGLYDALGHRLLDYPGRLAPRLQLVNAPCLSLNGVDQRVSFTEITPNPLLHCFVLIFKMNVSAEAFTYLLSRGNTSLLALSFSGNNALSYRGNSSSGSRIIDFTFNNDINDGEWHTLVINIRQLINNTEEAVMYLDGFANNEGYRQEDFFGGTGFTDIGHDSSRTFDGSLSFLGVYNKNLTQNEIEEFSQTHSLPSDSAVVRKYVFSEGTDTIIYDVSGNSNHGTVVNAVLPDIWGTQDIYHYEFYNGLTCYPSLNVITNSAPRFKKENSSVLNAGMTLDNTDTYWEVEFSFKETGGSRRLHDQANFNLRANHNGMFLKGNDINGNVDEELILENSSADYFNKWYKFRVVADKNADTTQLFMTDLETGIEYPSQVEKYIYLRIPFTFFGRADSLGANGGLAYIKFSKTNNSPKQEYRFDEAFIESNNKIRCKINPELFIELENDLTENITSHNLNVSQPYSFYREIKGYEETNQFNGASDIQFPDIPEVPKSLRAKTFTPNEIDAVGAMGFRLARNTHDLLVLSEPLDDLSLTRYLNLRDYEPETNSYKDFTGAHTIPDSVSDKNLFELDVFIKALKKGLNLDLGQRNLNSVFDYLFIFAIDVPTELYQDTNSAYTDIPRYWAIDIANNRVIRERSDKPFVNFLTNKGISTTTGEDRLSIAGYDLDEITNSSVVYHKNIEMGTFFIENTVGVSNDYIASGYNNSDAVGLYMGVQWQSANSGRIAARLNSSSLRYSDYFDPVEKLISCKRIGDAYYYFVDGELANTHPSITAGAIPTEQYFAFMSSAWSGGGFSSTSCRNPIAINYMANAEELNTKVLSECFRDYYNKRNLTS